MTAITVPLRLTTTSRFERQARSAFESERRRPAYGRALALALLVAVAMCSTGCKGCSHSEQPIGAALSSAEPVPVAAPSGLIAALRITNPATSWPALRDLLGLDVLPRGPEILLTGLLDLPAIVAGQFDAAAPIGGVVLRQQDRLETVFAVRLKSEREMIATLTTGAEATFNAKAGGNDVTVLERKGSPSDWVLATFHAQLLIGKNPNAIIEVAPYLATQSNAVVQKEAAPLELSLPHAALASEGGPFLRSAWSRYANELVNAEQVGIMQHGRAADLADPKAVILGLSSWVESVAGFLESSEEIRITALPEAERLTISAELLPAANGSAQQVVSSLHSGALKELARLPAQTPFALLSYDADQEPSQFAARAAAGFTTLFGQRLSSKDHDRISNAFAALAAGFTSPTIYGSFVENGRSALFVKSRLQDPDAFRRGMEQCAALCQLPALTNLFDSTIGGVKPLPRKWDVATLGGPGGGVTFRIGGAKGAKKEAYSLVWFENAGFGYVVFGEDPLPPLVGIREPQQALGTMPGPAKLIDFDAEQASFALFLRTDPDPSSASGSSLIFGRSEDNRGRLRFRASRATVTDLVALLQKLGASEANP